VLGGANAYTSRVMANVSRTAAYVALYRALETMERRRPPLFRDPYASRLLPRQLRAALLLARVYRARYLPASENKHGYAFYRLALAERVRSDA
jgi:O-methyltransferase involved in polyketide biosynthesis